MFVNLVQIKLKSGVLDEFKKLTQPLVAASQQEDGCIEYNVYHDEKDPLVVCFIEKWHNQEVLDRHETLPHFTSVIGKLVALCAEPSVKNKFFVIE